MASRCMNVQDTFSSIHAGRLWHVERRATSHRNRNDPLIQCDSLCCSSALGRKLSDKALSHGRPLLRNPVCVCGHGCVFSCLHVFAASQTLESWCHYVLSDLDLCNSHGFDKNKYGQTHKASFRCVVQVCAKRDVFGSDVLYLQYRGQQIAICGGCTSACVCSRLSWLLAQLCCGGHTAHLYLG